MKSSNKGQPVGEKYSGIEFLGTLGRTPASGSLLEGTPVPRIPTRRNPGSPLWRFPDFPMTSVIRAVPISVVPPASPTRSASSATGGSNRRNRGHYRNPRR
ncbi:hypothetical protein DY000_02014531 [Brassica cretica]|uniref:Uncharacterized protein n=1 Tax=Brassica cretica TaxID=69181 RepID=A0ABQ7CPB7_BRACR|nr:hypothetical protein DY000_02014531 [Brassica cretica]